MKVRNLFKDMTGIFRTIKMKRDAVKNADGSMVKEDRINLLAKKLHPGKIKAVVSNIVNETNNARRITLSSKDIPMFYAGTYLTVELQIGESLVTRAYSIVTSPLTAFKEKYVEIIVKDYPDGFVSTYLNHEINIGDELLIEVGLGQLYINEYRDGKNIVAIAGGAGITPFIAMAHDIIDRKLDINLTILYGSDNPNSIIAKDELDSLVQDNIKVVHVISGDYPFKGEKGFINKKIIKKYAPDNATYFFCGSKLMYDSIIRELKELNVDLRRIRKESFPISDISIDPDFDFTMLDKEFVIEVHQGTFVKKILALASEPIAVALERSGLRILTSCRGGSCGVCRIKVIKGEYYIPIDSDHRREMDKKFNYVHSCSTYPMSDLIIKINIA